MDNNELLLDRFRGALMGLAVGDATGTSVEFYRPGFFDEVVDMTGGGIFNMPCGAWTDDTSMALCLAESLIESKGFDPLDQLKRYSRWYKEGYMSSIPGDCFDIGTSTRESLETYLASVESGEPMPFPGDEFPEAAGNGSLMRLAPISLAYYNNPLLVSYAVNSSRVTHGSDQAIDCCAYYSQLITRALSNRGETLTEITEAVRNEWPDYSGMHSDVLPVADGSYRDKEPPEIKGVGYVPLSMEAALWAFDRTDNYREAVLRAVNLGNDADTTAAIVGQLAGAYYGFEAIPKEWVEKVVMRDEIIEFADGLFDLNKSLSLSSSS